MVPYHRYLYTQHTTSQANKKFLGVLPAKKQERRRHFFCLTCCWLLLLLTTIQNKNKIKTMSKRKASNANIFDEVTTRASGNQPLFLSYANFLNPKMTPRVIAEALLALLPNGATSHDANTKKLLRAFALLTAELDARSSTKSKVNESEGLHLPFTFRPTASNSNDGGCDILRRL